MRHFLRRGKNAAPQLVFAAALSVAALVVAPCVASAQTAVPALAVTVDVREARLEDAVQLLTKQTRVNNVVFVNDPGKSFGVVTVKMEDQPFEKVLRAMATSAQAVVTLEDGIYYLRPRGAEAVPTKAQAAPSVPTQEQPVAKRRKSQTVNIPLQYLLPSAFKNIVEKNGEVLQEDSLRPKLEAEIEKKRRSPYDLANPNVVLAAQSAGASTPKTTLTPTSDTVSPQPTEGNDGGNQRGGFGGGGGFQGGGFQGGGQNGGNRGGGGQNGGPNGGQQNGGFLPEGVDQIIAYDANNSLLVRGEPEGIEELRALIRFLDVAPRQVNIKVEFVQLNINDSDQFGIDWQFKFANNIDTNIPSQGGSTPTFTLAYASGNTVANLRASLIRNTGNLIQSPIISTTNNTPASIFFNSNQPIFNTTTFIGAIGQGNTTATTVQYIPVTNGLQVVPHINGDNSISMGIAPQLSRFTVVNGPGGQTAYSIVSQTLTTFRRVQSGETIMLGGFITKQEDRQIQKVPVLADLPIIGNLFTQTTRTRTGEEVLVFLTPTIIEDRSQGTTGTLGAPSPTP